MQFMASSLDDLSCNLNNDDERGVFIVNSCWGQRLGQVTHEKFS